MTRFEKWKELSVNDVAYEICNLIANDTNDCDNCPVYDRCYTGHNGVLDYLMEGVD